MKTVSLLVFLFLFFGESLIAISFKGSPDRCKQKDWFQVDTLLPLRNANGTYPQPMAKITEKFNNIAPKQMLQSVVDHLLTFNDFCGQRYAGRGGYEDSIGTDLCERLAVYNITQDGILTNEQTSKKSMFSAEDLNFLKSVFKSCRPSTARWWNYPLVVHVSFQPTSQELEAIGQNLNIKF